jgi:beta-galactosidase
VKRALLALLLVTTAASGQETVRVDAAASPPAPRSEQLHMGTAEGPGGTIGINSQYLTRDGRPWLPVMGEFHFTRTPAAEWEAEILKMKAAGVTIVSSYAIWNQIELAPGTLDWTGDRDLRRFVQLCAKHGMLFFLRPGPWAHAEARFGGIPDWVVARTRPRSDDAAYLAEVNRFWTGMYAQVRGLLWKDGGPIVGMQIENEYNLDGPGQGRGHIATLKALAQRIGYDVPLYTVTGWDHTIYPRGQVVPVMGGYVDEPWSAKTGPLGPKENYLFRFRSRVSGDLGAQTRGAKVGDADSDTADTPFLGAEYGAGVPVMYRRRPLLDPIDVSAAITAQLGSGVNLLGYYMFHGGANPLVDGRAIEETQASGGYNDVPQIGYDFQAPLGQYGEVGPVSAALRPLHYFLGAYGDRLATMTAREPAVVPSGNADLATLRWSVRSDGASAFLFVNNHVRQSAMPARRDVRFEVALKDGVVRLPPVDIAADASFVWPINLDLDGVRLAWATAQPLTRLTDASGPIHVLSATGPGTVDLAFAPGTTLSVPSRRDAAGQILASVTPSATRTITATARDGRRVRLVVLDQAAAKRAWVGDVFGQRRLVLTDADVFVDAGRLVLHQRGDARFAFAMLPQAALSVPQTRGGDYAATVATAQARDVTPSPLRPAGEAPPIQIGGPAKSAMQPLPEAHRAAAAWSFRIPRNALPAGGDAFLEIDYRGDIARLFDGDTMLDDAFWDGRIWRIGLRRFADRLGKPWTLTVLPLRADAPIYLDAKARQMLSGTSQVAEIRNVRVVPEHELVVTAR